MKDSIREITQTPELTMGLDLGDKLEVLKCQMSHGKLSSLCLSKAHWNQRHSLFGMANLPCPSRLGEKSLP